MSTETNARHALVVYESMFGSTRAVAEAIGGGLRTHIECVDVLAVADAPDTLDGLDVVVVGGPTHAFGMSRARTRAAAAAQGATAPTDRGVREWLASLPKSDTRPYAGAFTTRFHQPYAGRASRGIERRLRRLGCEVFSPLDAIVEGISGPIADGELNRAHQWGAMLPVRPILTGAAATEPAET